jgi:ankyrin repeat protein
MVDLDAIAALLLEGGADIEAQNNKGKTPLHAVASAGSAAVLQLLVDRGARINPHDIVMVAIA